MMIWSALPVLLLLISTTHTSSLNLLLVPQPIGSHIIMFNRLSVALIHQGHRVSMVLPSNVKTSLVDAAVDLHIYQGVGESNILASPELSEMFMKVKFSTSMKEHFETMFNLDDLVIPVTIEECKQLLDDDHLRQLLNKKKFDFAFMDHIGFSCLMNYPITLGLDYFLFSIPLFTWHSSIPDLPSFTPEVYSAKFSDEMSFYERMENTFYYGLVTFLSNTTNPVDLTRYPPGRAIPDLLDIQADALLWFWLDDPALSFPRPHMPNTISIGDIMVQEEQPLPDEFQQFLDQATGGALLVSFGSFVAYIPVEIIDKLCTAFDDIPQRIIWKSKFPPPCAERFADRMMVVGWMPQNSILAHPNLQLFFTHCGLNSLLEAVYHAKPMLGFPIALDQPYNAKVLVEKRYGLSVNLADFTSEEVVRKVQAIIGNKTIEKSIKFGSELIRDKPEPPEKRISYWVEHVAKYGANHLRTGAHKLSLFQFLMFDVVLTYIAIAAVVIVVVMWLLCCICRCFKRCGKSGKQKVE